MMPWSVNVIFNLQFAKPYLKTTTSYLPVEELGKVENNFRCLHRLYTVAHLQHVAGICSSRNVELVGLITSM